MEQSDANGLQIIHDLAQKAISNTYSESDLMAFRQLTASSTRLPDDASQADIQALIQVFKIFMMKKDTMDFGSYCLGTFLRYLRNDERVFQGFVPRKEVLKQKYMHTLNATILTQSHGFLSFYAYVLTTFSDYYDSLP